MTFPDGSEPEILDDAAAARIVQMVTRSLLRAQTPEDAVEVLLTAVARFGGEVVPAEAAGDEALPVDLSFGLGDPLLPVAPLASVPRMHLERHLPGLVEDTRAAIDVLRARDRLAIDASTDGLTGLLNRRGLDRVLGRVQAGDALVLADLDRFKDVNDRHGHATGDQALAAFARALRAELRAIDHVGRRGGDEFMAVLPRTDVQQALAVLARVRVGWRTWRPLPVTFSCGVAEVAVGEPAEAALERADAALLAAKRDGRDHVAVAAPPPPT